MTFATSGKRHSRTHARGTMALSGSDFRDTASNFQPHPPLNTSSSDLSRHEPIDSFSHSCFTKTSLSSRTDTRPPARRPQVTGGEGGRGGKERGVGPPFGEDGERGVEDEG